MSISFIKRAMLIAVVASFGAMAPSYADSESGGFVFGGGDSESGGAMGSGSSSASGVLWGRGSSESGGALMNGSSSESGGVVNNGSESESGGARNSGASSEAPVEPVNMERDNPFIKNYKWVGNGRGPGGG